LLREEYLEEKKKRTGGSESPGDAVISGSQRWRQISRWSGDASLESSHLSPWEVNETVDRMTRARKDLCGGGIGQGLRGVSVEKIVVIDMWTGATGDIASRTAALIGTDSVENI
jgi:hypothetical protein